VDDLAIIIVSTNEGHWLRRCLTTVFAHAGDISLDVVVANNESTDETRDVVESFAGARVVPCENRGFAHANNRGYMTCDARYALFLNPDTEILHGTFEELVRALDERPEVGLAGVRQVTGDLLLSPTMRRFPNALRALAEAFGSDRVRRDIEWLGERVPTGEAYDRETRCDWTSGSFMLARREALESAGLMDERFFLYSEEPDLSLRLAAAGWETRHLPFMTIVHHAGKAGISPRIEAQDAFARRQYARKHFSPLHRLVYLGAIGLRYVFRLAIGGRSKETRRVRREASRRALRTLVGLERPPYMDPPPQAVRLRAQPAEELAAATSESR
jgi:N-acetylglucosaminyl-diphospho-decaprenol L-rhamnosyltransferase